MTIPDCVDRCTVARGTAPRFARFVLLVALILVPGLARAGTFHETFSTSQYKDGSATSADWNVGLGQLRLAPLNHASLGRYALPGTALDVATDGRYAYVAAGSAGLVIESLANPAAPVTVGSYDTPGSAMAVVVRSARAFVADGVGGLKVIDVSDPAHPVLLASVATPDTCFGVDVEGSYAYLALGLSGVESVYIANPTSPAVVAAEPVPGRTLAVAASPSLGLVFIASGQPTLYVTAIGHLGTVISNDSLAAGRAVDVACDYNGVYVAAGTGGLQIMDPEGQTVDGPLALPGETTRIAFKDGMAVLANSVDGLEFVDIRNRFSPARLAGAAVASPAAGIALTGDMAYVAEGAGGLDVVRKAEPSAFPPVQVSGSNFGLGLNDLCFSGDHAYAAGEENAYFSGVQIFRVYPDGHLDPRGYAFFPNGNFQPISVDAVDVMGNRVYIAADAAGLGVFDVTDDRNPSWIASVVTPGFTPYAVRLVNNIAYVSGNGLRIYDVTNPVPVLLGGTNYPSTSIGLRIDVAAKRVYVALTAPPGLAIYDVSNPAAPALLGQYQVPVGNTFSCALGGNLVALCEGARGTEILDVQNPALPVQRALIPPGVNDQSHYDAVFSGSNVVIGSALGVRAFDVSDPSAPRLVSRADDGLPNWRLASRGERVYIANLDPSIRYAQLEQHFWASPGLAQSLTVGPSAGSPVQRVRVTATGPSAAAPAVLLEASPNGGATWETVANGGWATLANAGTDLRWRATLTPFGADGESAPVIDDVVVDWRVTPPGIASIRDMPNDQGKQVRLDWEASQLDSLNSVTPILSYAIYRRIDPNLAVVQPAPDASRFSTMSESLRTQVEGMLTAGWDFVAQVPAVTDDEYGMVVPTLKDSTIASGPYFTTYRVLALTASPGVNFASAPDSGYSLDNLAPSVPANLLVQYVAGNGDSLSWDAATAPDFQYYRVYRSSDPSFKASPATLVQSTTSNHWTDAAVGATAYYKVTATDFSGNESPPASVAVLVGVDGPAGPLAFALHDNVPNPLVGVTTIRFSLPAASTVVTLRVYDVRGRLVRTLVDGPQPAGEHVASWDARDDAGRPVGVGVYLCTLTAPGHSATRKMLVVR